MVQILIVSVYSQGFFYEKASEILFILIGNLPSLYFANTALIFNTENLDVMGKTNYA